MPMIRPPVIELINPPLSPLFSPFISKTSLQLFVVHKTSVIPGSASEKRHAASKACLSVATPVQTAVCQKILAENGILRVNRCQIPAAEGQVYSKFMPFSAEWGTQSWGINGAELVFISYLFWKRTCE